MSALDHVQDTNGSELFRLAKLYGLPEFTKQADVGQTRDPGSAPLTAYADPSNRLYPCHTRASTYLSAMFFEEKQAAFIPRNATKIRERIDRAADYWGVRGDVDQMREKVSTAHADADEKLADADFGYVWTDEEGNKQRHLRMKHAAEVQAAAEWLHTYRDHLPLEQRQPIAGRIAKKAQEYGADLGDHEQEIQRQAGLGIPDTQRAAGMIRKRAQVCRNPEWRQEVEKLAQAVEHKPAETLGPDRVSKLAVTLDRVDRALNLTGQYGGMFERPEDVLCAVTHKEAQSSVDVACPLPTGRVYDRREFTKIAGEPLRTALGDAFAGRTLQADGSPDPEKLAEALPELPTGKAATFEAIAETHGVYPMLHKAASAGRFADLESFAGSY